jgi:hypothetical protein
MCEFLFFLHIEILIEYDTVAVISQDHLMTMDHRAWKLLETAFICFNNRQPNLICAWLLSSRSTLRREIQTASKYRVLAALPCVADPPKNHFQHHFWTRALCFPYVLQDF